MGEGHPDLWLHVEDVRGVVRLLGEAAASRHGAASIKRRIADGLGAIIGADAWVWARIEAKLDGTFDVGARSLLHGGIDEQELVGLLESTFDKRLPPPEREPISRELMERPGHLTRRRRDVLGDESWAASEHNRVYRNGRGLHEFIHSFYPLVNGQMSAVAFYRRAGGAAFSERDRRVVHLVLSEIGAVHFDGVDGAPVGEGAGVLGLTPRVRIVFGLLLEGWSRSRIAEELQLSRHTVAEYAQKIYRHFGVRGQAALQARFLRGDGGDVSGTPQA